MGENQKKSAVDYLTGLHDKIQAENSIVGVAVVDATAQQNKLQSPEYVQTKLQEILGRLNNGQNSGRDEDLLSHIKRICIYEAPIIDKLVEYTVPGMSMKQVYEITLGLWHGIDAKPFAKKSYSPMKMRHILVCLYYGLDVAEMLSLTKEAGSGAIPKRIECNVKVEGGNYDTIYEYCMYTGCPIRERLPYLKPCEFKLLSEVFAGVQGILEHNFDVDSEEFLSELGKMTDTVKQTCHMRYMLSVRHTKDGPNIKFEIGDRVGNILLSSEGSEYVYVRVQVRHAKRVYILAEGKVRVRNSTNNIVVEDIQSEKGDSTSFWGLEEYSVNELHKVFIR